MTNEEKAREIAECNDGHINIISFESAKIMAEWKDNQFKEYLDKKNTEISNTKAKLGRDDADYMLCTLKSLFIDEIINELFKGD